jgi:hypothetical protein
MSKRAFALGKVEHLESLLIELASRRERAQLKIAGIMGWGGAIMIPMDSF